ncbi:MAG: 4-hydroxy-tetrahydrodipicolinate reductase [Phenylobacterium sp.]
MRIAIAGAEGRMGRAVAAALDGREGLVLGARFDQRVSAEDGLVSADEAIAAADVVVDFTTPGAAAALAERLAQAGGKAMVCGPTGWSDAELARIAAAAKTMPIVRAGNFSLGVNLMLGLVRQAAASLSAADYDIEVIEAHHRRKVDAPSGTALMLGEAAAAGRGVELAQTAQRARDGITGARRAGDIGFAVIRGGGVVGEHSVLFAAEDEILTLSHSARDRSLFARGAVEAARWVHGKPPGEYDMLDVLGLS